MIGRPRRVDEQKGVNKISAVDPLRTVRTALIIACDIAGLTVVAYLVVSRIFHAELNVGLIFGADRLVLLSLVAAFIVLGRLARRIDPRLTLASFAVLASVGAGLIGLSAFGVDVENRVRSALMPVKERLFAMLFQTREPQRLYRHDDRYGYVLVPNMNTTGRGRGFTVSYTTDAEGHRRMPAPSAPRATVVLLGDSFTFGEGVNDDETFPYVLATEHWTDVRLVNAGVGGWGLTQFYLKLTDMLARAPLPDAVILVIVNDDLRRSHLRPPRASGLRQRLEWIDGQFVMGEVARRGVVADTPELLEREARQATSTLQAMVSAARSKGVTFALVLLEEDYPPDLLYTMGREGVPMLDLTRLAISRLPYDTHPDAAGHRSIAAAIAASPLTPLVRHRGAGRDGAPDDR